MKAKLTTLPDKPRGSAWRSSARGVNCPVKSGKLVSSMKKFKLNPKISYMLGIYGHTKQEGTSISASSDNEDAIEKYIKIAMEELGISASSIKIAKHGKVTTAMFYHSKAKKEFERILNKREKLFKYMNAYALEYLGGMVDSCSGMKSCADFRNIDAKDCVIIENLGFHIMHKGSICHVLNGNAFVSFVKGHSMKALMLNIKV